MQNLNDLRTFIVVVDAGSFTKASAQLNLTQSAVSHSVRQLENRLKIKLLNRTTRSLSTTDSGEQLYARIKPLLAMINGEIDALGDLTGSLRGQLRINGTDLAFVHVLWQKIADFCQAYPNIELELVSDVKFTDIVAERFDAGIRLGDDVAKDMIAVRVSDDLSMCVVATPDFLAEYGTPKTPYELTHLPCIGLRLPTHGGLLGWEFSDPKRHKMVKVTPNTTLISNSTNVNLQAVLSHQGFLWTPRIGVQDYLTSGKLLEVLNDWAIIYPGFYLYYPNRRADYAPLKAFIDKLRA